jgi:glucose-6-phosphate-specific signal transduction histidine kinase
VPQPQPEPLHRVQAQGANQPGPWFAGYQEHLVIVPAMELSPHRIDEARLRQLAEVSEPMANAAKHAHASAVHVELDASHTTLQLAIRDDGIGGADPAKGSGLTGLRDRIEALGGTIDVTSPTGGGTTLLIEIPV